YNAVRSLDQHAAIAPLGLSDPAAGQVRVEAMGHRHCGARHARRTAGRHDLRLELGAVFAPASTATADFFGDSVHVSTKSFVDTSILKRSAVSRVPRRDAYLEANASQMFGVILCRVVAIEHYALITDHASGSIGRRRVDASRVHRRLGAGHEEGAGLMHCVQTLEVDIAREHQT